MSISQLTLSWRTGANVHHVRIDDSGVVHRIVEDYPPYDEAEPFTPAPYTPPVRTDRRRSQVWTEEDEAILRAGFEAAEAPADLAVKLGRSRGAVTARLVKLGLVDEAEAGLRYPVQKPKPAPEPETTTPNEVAF